MYKLIAAWNAPGKALAQAENGYFILDADELPLVGSVESVARLVEILNSENG